jgi:hypothetical protein
MKTTKKAKANNDKVPHTLADELEMSIVVGAVDAQLKAECVKELRDLTNRVIELEEIIDGQTTTYANIPF